MKGPGVSLLFAASLALLCAGRAAAQGDGGQLPSVAVNDNRRPAGIVDGGALVLDLRAAFGVWRPEGPHGPALTIEAFGEEGGPLQVPAPLLRVRRGTEVRASVRNNLDTMLRVHGLCAREGAAFCAPVDVPPGERRDVRFTADRAGTYHYWATTTGMPLQFRGSGDTQLSGAFIVDPPEGADTDRVLVLTEWTSLTRRELREVANADDPGVAFLAINPRVTFLINGLSWPSTERFEYRLNDRVRWRIVNLSSQMHPMHLHGFYFDVDSLGDGLRDTAFDVDARQHVVTQLLPPGATMTMSWRAERAGKWLFHCHVMEHVSPKRHLGSGDTVDAATPHHGSHASGGDDGSAGMAGMIIGITVVDPRGPGISDGTPGVAPRRLRLEMRTRENRDGGAPAYGFALMADGHHVTDDHENVAPAPATVMAPGPTIALRRGEPVEITLVNLLGEPTSIHWHGIELESFYDGVHGWSGAGAQTTPLIEPGESFTVRFTPPRAGTFIYHTHLHDDRQLPSGLYGALLVLEPGEASNPAVDHVVVIGRSGVTPTAPVLLNGDRAPHFQWPAGTRHRIRLVNITPGDIFVVSLVAGTREVEWRPLTKDGAPVPPANASPRPAATTIAVGETFDFEYEAPAGRQTLWLNVRSPAGRWHAQAHVGIK